MSVQRNCMLLEMAVGGWAGRRLDRAIGQEVTAAKLAKDDALSVNKQLVPKEVLAPVQAAANAVRSHFYDATLPWSQHGARVVTRRGYTAFLQKHHELREAFEREIETLVTTTYPQAVAAAEFRMGLAFDLADYPLPETLRDKFYVTLEINPVPVGADFRVDMSNDETAFIQQDIEARVRQRTFDAAASVWERLRVVIDHYQKTMANADIKFKEATVRNLQDLVEALPALNVLEDPRLEAFGAEVRQSLSWSAKELRASDDTREGAAQEAERILKSMDSFMNAFQPAEAA